MMRAMMAAVAACGLGGCMARNTADMLNDIKLQHEQPAKVVFGCPVPGTRTIRSDAKGLTSTYNPISPTVATWAGSDPNDPFTCIVQTAGKPDVRLLYGWYPLPSKNEDDVRAGMAAAFSGQIEEACFLNPPTIASAFYRNCWLQVGKTSIKLEGVDTSVILFLQSSANVTNAATFASWYRFYDPQAHLFVRSEVKNTINVNDDDWTRKVIPVAERDHAVP